MAAQRSMTSSPAKAFDWKNFRLRALSAIVLAPLVVGIVWLGGPAFLALVAIAVILLAREWGRMSAPKAPIRAALGIAVAILAALFIVYAGQIGLGWVVLGVGALLSALFARMRSVGERAADEALGVLYIGPAALTLIWLRSGADGLEWTLVLLASAWCADIAAFLVGSVLKGPKLWPRFSPNKTWSGFVGGLVAATGAAAVVAICHRHDLALIGWIALIGLATGLATMAGDLWESMLKRRFGVKDSGGLIPGHGGLLDRVDGLMFAIVTLAVIRLLAQTFGTP